MRDATTSRRLVAVAAAVLAILGCLATSEPALAGSWTTATDPSGQIMYADACPSLMRCFAVGGAGAIVTTADGGNTWTSMTSNTTQTLNGVACTSTTACYAVGNGDTIDVYNGTTWTVSASNPNPGATLEAISCPAAGSCFASSSDGEIVRLASGLWTDIVTPTTQILNAISCAPGTTTCAASGNVGTIITTTNGTVWTTSTSNTTKILYGMSCASATFCVAVGGSGVIDQWNGTTWTLVSPLPATSQLNAVSCRSTTHCAASANDGSIDELHGTTWTNVNSATTKILNGIALTPDGLGGVASGNTGVLEVYRCTLGTSLGVDTASTFALPTMTLNGLDQSVSSTLAIDVDDQTSDYAGWNLQLATSQFTSGSHTLPASAVTLTSMSTAADADNCNLPTASVATPLALSTTATKIYNAAAATGIGGTTLNAGVSLTAPGNAYSGSYNSTWTLTAATGP